MERLSWFQIPPRRGTHHTIMASEKIFKDPPWQEDVGGGFGLDLPPRSAVTLDRTLSLSEASFLTLSNGIRIVLSWDFPGGPLLKTLPSSVEGVGSLPGQGSKTPRAMWCGQN